MTKLSDALPDWMRRLPLPLSDGEVSETLVIVDAPRGKRFRQRLYVCPEGHTLGQVIATKRGPTLILQGMDRLELDRSIWQQSAVVLMKRRHRNHAFGIRITDLSAWLAALNPTRTPRRALLRCRCGIHELDLRSVAGEERRRVVLPRL